MQATPPLRPVRDAVTTIRDDGSRRFLFPADSKGRFASARRYFALGLMLVYLLLPWIPVGGYPAVFLDVARRRFHLFGLTLAAQDAWLLFFLISGLGFGLFFVTALFGRLWCGWACPQTVFLDHVYRRVERWIDGDSVQRRLLDEAPWTPGKIARRVAKHTSYLLISAGVVHLFAAYFVSLAAVWEMMSHDPARNWGAFVAIGTATGLIYFNFAWFREQLCIVICPYGRLQSALTDEHTLVIGYDASRGEPRRGIAGIPSGDCVSCDRCVKVCPTGIDIRQGLQMECIGCAACVDACDDVMERTGRAKGLIRYDSLAGLAGKPTQWLRPRTIVYSILLAIGAAVAGWSLAGIRPASLSVVRMVGSPYFCDSGSVRNQFLVRLVNKRSSTVLLRVAARGLPASATVQGLDRPVEVGPLGEEVRPLVVQVPRMGFTGPFAFEVEASDPAGSFNISRTMEFIGPETAGNAIVR